MTKAEIILAIFFSAVFATVLLGGVFMIVYSARRTRLRLKLSFAESEALYQRELRLVAGEVQEQLFSNLSEELHNNIGQRLTLVHIQLQACESLSAASLPILAAAGTNLVEAMKQVRQLSHALSAEVITYNGLASMIQQAVSRLSQNGRIAVQYEPGNETEEPDLTADQRLVAFRIFQEAVNNALKHSGASTLFIRMHSTNPFRLEVADDGVGFDVHSLTTESKGVGLRHMQQRATLAYLRFTIESSRNTGTSCQIEKTM